MKITVALFATLNGSFYVHSVTSTANLFHKTYA